MKKIFCDYDREDFIRVNKDGDGGGMARVAIQCDGDYGVVRLSPDKIRKLRKQLKKALVAIEGDSEDWFSEGKLVEITANQNGHGFTMGDKVRVGNKTIGENIKLCWSQNNGDYWWVINEDCKAAS